MNPQVAVQRVLQNKLTELQSRNPRFSLRSYAKKLQMSPGAVSSLLNGKRFISKKMALRIVDRLMLDPQERSGIIAAFEASKKKLHEEDVQYLRLTTEQFRLIAEWEHLAILSLMNVTGFRSDLKWISERLGIPLSQVKKAVDRLIRLELIKTGKDGKWTREKTGLRTSDDIADISIKKFHDKNLELAKESLHRDDTETRDFSAVTFAIDPEKLPEAKAIIRKCQDQIAELLESGNQTEVYRFSSQLFPLTLPKKIKGDRQ